MVWILIYIVICLGALGIIGLAGLLLVREGIKIFRTGKRGFTDIKPHATGIMESGDAAFRVGNSIMVRTTALIPVFSELAGRWAYIAQTVAETQKSSVVKAADLAGRATAIFSGHRNKKAEKRSAKLWASEQPVHDSKPLAIDAAPSIPSIVEEVAPSIPSIVQDITDQADDSEYSFLEIIKPRPIVPDDPEQ